jgi:hypothetical protein
MSNFTHTIVATVEDAPGSKWGRKLVFTDEGAFRFMLLRYTPGTKILIGTKQYRAKHSPEARGYLRGVVIPFILDAMGWEQSKENNDLMYIKLKEKFGQAEIRVGKNNEEMVFARSMAEADTLEMHQLIEGSVRWAGEFLGITIPPPQRVMIEGAGI